MRKRVSVALAATVVVASICTLRHLEALADSSRVGALPTPSAGTFQTTVVIASTAAVSGYGVRSTLFGFTVHPSSSNSECGLYDSTTLGGANRNQGVFIDEGGAATQYNTFQSNWPAPYTLINGLTVIVNAGACIIYGYPQTFPS